MGHGVQLSPVANHLVWNFATISSLHIPECSMTTLRMCENVQCQIRQLTGLTVISVITIWAMSWENLLIPYANNKGADQPAHPRSLISTFVVRCLDTCSIIPLVSISKILSLCLASVAAQAGLSLTWSQTPKVVFLVTSLILYSSVLKFVCSKNNTYEVWKELCMMSPVVVHECVYWFCPL